MNVLNEKLAIIRRQKAMLKKKMNNEEDGKKRVKIAEQIAMLNVEEKEVLKVLGLDL